MLNEVACATPKSRHKNLQPSIIIACRKSSAAFMRWRYGVARTVRCAPHNEYSGDHKPIWFVDRRSDSWADSRLGRRSLNVDLTKIRIRLTVAHYSRRDAAVALRVRPHHALNNHPRHIEISFAFASKNPLVQTATPSNCICESWPATTTWRRSARGVAHGTH